MSWKCQLQNLKQPARNSRKEETGSRVGLSKPNARIVDGFECEGSFSPSLKIVNSFLTSLPVAVIIDLNEPTRNDQVVQVLKNIHGRSIPVSIGVKQADRTNQ